jgi:hypothetical protein
MELFDDVNCKRIEGQVNIGCKEIDQEWAAAQARVLPRPEDIKPDFTACFTSWQFSISLDRKDLPRLESTPAQL